MISDSALADLSKILGTRSIDDHRKVIASRRAEINKELTVLPARIDEVERSLPDITGLDAAALQAEAGTKNERMHKLAHQVMKIENGGEIADKTSSGRDRGQAAGDQKRLLCQVQQPGAGQIRRAPNLHEPEPPTLRIELQRHNGTIESNNEAISHKNSANGGPAQRVEQRSTPSSLYTRQTAPAHCAAKPLPEAQIEVVIKPFPFQRAQGCAVSDQKGAALNRSEAKAANATVSTGNCGNGNE